MGRKIYSTLGRGEVGFTAREIAALSGTTVRDVHRCVEEGIVGGIRVAGERRFPRHAAYFLSVKAELAGATLSKRLTRKLYSEIAGTPDDELSSREIALTDALRVHAGARLGVVVVATCRYEEARDGYITQDPEVLGGIPIIRGTRVDVYSIAQRLESGESVAELSAGYPEVPVDAFEAAKLFAETHPRRGRPRVGRPAIA